MNKTIKKILQVLTFPFYILQLVCIILFLSFIGLIIWIVETYNKIWSEEDDKE